MILINKINNFKHFENWAAYKDIEMKPDDVIDDISRMPRKLDL